METDKTDEHGQERDTPPWLSSSAEANVNVMLMKMLSSMQQNMTETNKLLFELKKSKPLHEASSSFENLPISNETNTPASQEAKTPASQEAKTPASQEAQTPASQEANSGFSRSSADDSVSLFGGRGW